jgi:hypothetical protein
MIVYAMLKAFNTGSTRDHAIIAAMKLAVTCLMRVSEYLPGSPGGVEHWLRSQDVAFAIQSVIITIRSAKNDSEGEGHRMEFSRIALDATHAFDLAADMYSWAARAQPLFGQPFLSFRGEWVLKYDTLSKAIKRVAKEMGLDPTRY